MPLVHSRLKIVLPDRIIEEGYIVVHEGDIVEVGEGAYQGELPVEEHPGLIAMPGFIDIHTHGVAGIDFMKASPFDFLKAARALYQEGITTFLVTTLTSSEESLTKVCDSVKQAKAFTPSIAGIHLEGPFLNPAYSGAQNKEFLSLPNIEMLSRWIKASNGNIRLLTIAPELEGAMDVISYAKDKGITVSAGHSAATFKEAEEAIAHGLTALTHTHNAMSPHHHRNPGLVTAGMNFDSLYTEMILDGIHVAPEVVRTWFKVVGSDRFVIVTDSLPCKRGGSDSYLMEGLPVHLKNGAVYLESGNLAGSVLEMDQAVRNFIRFTGASLIDAAKAASLNPAKEVGLKDVGSIEAGKRADIVLLDDSLHIVAVYKDGTPVVRK